MTIEDRVFTALSPLVGVDNDGDPCCYQVVMPQQPVYPAIVFQVTSGDTNALTQAGRFGDFIVLVTLYALDKAAIKALRANVLGAAEAMPEYKTHDELGDGYNFEPKTYSWKINFDFRYTET